MSFDKDLAEIKRKMALGMEDYEWCLSRWERMGKRPHEFHQEFFPLPQEDYPDYDTLLKSIGETVVRKDKGSYQGDSWVLVKRGASYGVIIFGWGSCSGCDALEAAHGDPEDVQCVRDNLIREAKWGNPVEILDYFKKHDWGGDWHFHYAASREFVRDSIKYLEDSMDASNT